MKDIGLVLRTEIEKRGLQQKIVAQKSGFSDAHLEKICDALGISPMSVFEVDGEIAESVKVSADPEDTKQLKTLLKEKQKRVEALEEALASTKELLSMYRDKNGTRQP